jgi:hormone-sensitive lipase
LEVLASLFPKAFFISEEDFFNQKENSDIWLRIKKNYQRVIPHSNHIMKKKLQNLLDLIVLGNASISKANNFNNKYLKFFGAGYYMAYYFFNKKFASIQSKRFSVRPETELSRMVWNLLDTKGIKHGLKALLYGIQNIKFKKKLYLRKTEKQININYIKKLLEKHLSTEKSEEKACIKIPSSQMVLEDHYLIDDKDDDFAYNTNGDLFTLNATDDKMRENYIKVKLLSSSDFFIPKLRSKWGLFTCCSSERNFTRDSLIIHIHGGGFVAMSSSSHENYLRKWCNRLEVPVLSIDYRLSPENPYPKALDDVWQAYNWILKYASDEFNIELNKIILVGDSAGGNLALALTYLLILHGKRLPDALFLAYPGKIIT